MNQTFRATKLKIIFSKPPSFMQEDVKDEVRHISSTFQRLDSKIEALQFSIEEDLKLSAAKDDLKQFATKDDLKQFLTKDDLNLQEERMDHKFVTKEDLKLFATKEGLRIFPTKEDLFRLEERNNLRFATKDNFSHQKSGLIKWIFTFWITLVIMILGLYLKK